jgi:hypothetical protein
MGSSASLWNSATYFFSWYLLFLIDEADALLRKFKKREEDCNRERRNIGANRAAGCHRLWLHASHLGRPLYESLGFEASNEMN